MDQISESGVERHVFLLCGDVHMPHSVLCFLTANSRRIANRTIHHPGAIDHHFNNCRHQRDCRRFCKFLTLHNTTSYHDI